MRNGLDNLVAAAAGVTLAAAPMAHAANNAASSAVLNAPASQVAAVDSSVALRTEMESLLPEAFKARYYLPALRENKERLLFYYEGLATRITDKALLTTRTKELVCFLLAYQENNKAVPELQKAVDDIKKGKKVTTQGLKPIQPFIDNLSPLFSGDYSVNFEADSREAKEIYAKGRELQKAIGSGDLEAVAIAQENLKASQRVLDASRERLTATRVELAAKKREATQTGAERQQTAQIKRETTQLRQALEKQ